MVARLLGLLDLQIELRWTFFLNAGLCEGLSLSDPWYSLAGIETAAAIQTITYQMVANTINEIEYHLGIYYV